LTWNTHQSVTGDTGVFGGVFLEPGGLFMRPKAAQAPEAAVGRFRGRGRAVWWPTGAGEHGQVRHRRLRRRLLGARRALHAAEGRAGPGSGRRPLPGPRTGSMVAHRGRRTRTSPSPASPAAASAPKSAILLSKTPEMDSPWSRTPLVMCLTQHHLPLFVFRPSAAREEQVVIRRFFSRHAIKYDGKCPSAL